MARKPRFTAERAEHAEEQDRRFARSAEFFYSACSARSAVNLGFLADTTKPPALGRVG
jgi:hypothetical protein